MLFNENQLAAIRHWGPSQFAASRQECRKQITELNEQIARAAAELKHLAALLGELDSIEKVRRGSVMLDIPFQDGFKN